MSGPSRSRGNLGAALALKASLALALALSAGAVSGVLAGEPEEAPAEAAVPRILIAYYSHSGNTRAIAELLHKKLGGILFQIEPVKPYPHDYDAVLEVARPQVEQGLLPDLKGVLPDPAQFDLALVGGPVWFGTLSPPVSSFLAKVDLGKKTIAPFCTYGGGMRGYFDNFAVACPHTSEVLEGLGLGRAQLAREEEEIDRLVSEWVAGLPLPE